MEKKSELLISVNHNFKNIWQCHLCNLNRRFPRSSTVVDTLLRSCQCLHAIFTAKSQLIVSTWEKKNSNIDPRKLMYITRQTSFLSLIYTTTNTVLFNIYKLFSSHAFLNVSLFEAISLNLLFYPTEAVRWQGVTSLCGSSPLIPETKAEHFLLNFAS